MNIIEDEAVFNIIYNSPSMTAQQKSDLVTGYLANRTEPAIVDQPLEYGMQRGAAVQHHDEDKQEVQATIMEQLTEYLDNNVRGIDQNTIDALVAENVSLQGNMGQAAVDFLATAIPLNMGGTYARIVEDFLPNKASLKHWLLPGEGLEAIKEELRGLSIEDQKSAIVDLMKAIESNAGHLGSNDFIKYMVLHAALKPVTDPYNENKGIDWDRVIENISGLLDIAFVGQMFFKGGATILKTINPRSPGGILRLVDRNESAKLLAEGMVDPNVAKMLGTTPEQIMADAILPKPMNYAAQPASPEIARFLEIQVANIKAIQRHTEFPSINLRHDEMLASPEAYKIALDEKAGGTLYQNLTQVGIDGEELVINAVYGANATTGFKSGSAAFDKAVELFGNTAEFKIMRNTPKGLMDAKKNLSRKGEYFIQQQTRRNFDAEDAMGFVDGDVKIGGRKAKWVADPSARFAKWISDAGIRAHDLGKRITAELHNMLRPFESLPEQSQMKVISAIQKGSKQEHVFTVAELKAGERFTDAEVKAYYGWRASNDALYMLNNDRFYKKLVRENKQYMTNNTSGGKYLVEDTTEAKAGMTALNPKTGEMIPLSQEAIDVILADGGKIMKMHKPFIKDGKGTDFVVMSKTHGTTLGPIPQNPLRWIEGYTTRYYKEKYFIEEEVEVLLNGSKAPTTQLWSVETAGTMQDAIRRANEMTASGNGRKYSAKRGAEHSADDRADRLLQVEEARGGVFFSERHAALKNQEGLVDIQDPVDSLLRAIATTSRAVSHDPFINSMMQRWMNSYGDLLAKGAKGFPDKFDLRQGPIGAQSRVNDAKALHDYITLMKGAPDPVAKEWKSFFMLLSEGLDKRGHHFWAKVAANRSDKDITSTMKGITFNMFLALNPVRQFALQTQQFLFVAPLAPVYTMSKLPRHSLGMDAAMLSGKMSKDGVESAAMMARGAKIAGMSDEDFRIMTSMFKDSGLPYAIDSNVFAAESIKHLSGDLAAGALRRKVNWVTAIPHKVMKGVKAVGFDFGEYGNLKRTWLIAARKYMKNNNKSWSQLSKRDADNIAANARQYSLSMTQAGSLGYQKGWLSMATQFLSIQHKALAAMLPERLGGNAAFTAGEKWRMFGGQTVFYGASGLGIQKAYEYTRDKLGVQTTPEMDILMQGGLVDWALNKTFQTTGISVAADFAPASGILETSEDSLTALFNGDINIWQVGFGPSSQATSRVYKGLQLAADMLTAPNLTNGERLGAAVSAMASIGSGYNNLMKGYMALRLGYHVDNKGDPVLQASFDEAIAQMGGFRSKGVKDYYELAHEQPGASEGGSSRRNEALSDIAREYHDRMKRIVSNNPFDPATSLNDLHYKRLEEAIATEASILAYLPPEELDVVLLKFSQMVKADKVKGKGDDLISAIAKKAINGEYGTDAEFMINKLRNSRMITTPQQEKDVRAIYDYITRED
jgi:hypothetical protein